MNIEENISQIEKVDISLNTVSVVKKKRGRPRKYPIEQTKNKVKKKEEDPKEQKIKQQKKNQLKIKLEEDQKV